ncbi:hypothetical protein V6N13_028980 [Hibiscus sabdariffa]|uniref:Uncharacterized protein n=2 Tax=Hibiscus sabdariffa TaxID=183260 RepID=A0ABR2ANS1_9ROSI
MVKDCPNLGDTTLVQSPGSIHSIQCGRGLARDGVRASLGYQGRDAIRSTDRADVQALIRYLTDLAIDGRNVTNDMSCTFT